MTALLRCALAAVSALLAMFLLGAFFTWEIDPGKWSDTARFYVASLGLMSALLAAAATAGLA